MSLLTDATIIGELARAWRDSCPDELAARHEEGGYIVLHTNGSHSVERWPRGQQAGIVPPPLDANNCYNGKVVMAAFHTHPNPPVDEARREWEQEPSASDRRWHARWQLRGFVLSRRLVYEIAVNGETRVVGIYQEVLSS